MNVPLQPGDPFAKVERIDLVVCTWNRAQQLKRMLASVFRLIVPYDCQLRLIVVDNNSTDETAQVIDDLGQSPFFKRHQLLALQQTRPGHCYARNKAIQSLDSDLTLWTDDDVLVDAHWVVNSVAIADAHAAIAFFGGKIKARLEPKKLEWIEENWELLKGCFAERDLGDQVVDLSLERLPYGANFAVRTKVQQQFPFDLTLGRRCNEILGEDEIDMFRRLLEQGWRGVWNPRSVVEHVVDATRVNEEYIRNYFIGQGRALVKKGQPWHDNQKRLWWAGLAHYLKYRFQRQYAASPAWLAQLIRSGLAEGQYAEMKAASKSDNRA